MATIKSYTDLQQSKKLAEILPLESADMFYMFESINKEPYYHPIIITEHSNRNFIIYEHNSGKGVVSWSLAALLDVLPNKIISHETAFDDEDAKDINEIYYKRIESNEEGSYVCCYVGNGYKYRCIADNPVDACYEMIIKFHELNLL